MFVVNFVPGGHRQSLGATCLVFGLGLIVGLIAGANPWTPPHDEVLAGLGALAGAVIGFLIAALDRIAVWVAFPEGAESPVEPSDDLADAGDREEDPSDLDARE